LGIEGDIMSARVVVVGNEKGGSGKSTVAMHVAIALIKSGQPVATVDLDTRQRSLTRLVENRRAWARHVGRDLGIPEHFCFGKLDYPTAAEEAAGCRALEETVETLVGRYGVVVIDTPGHDDYLSRVAHSLADTLITPLNDSFVDLDVLGTVHPETFRLTGTSHYAQMVEEARGRRRLQYQGITDWIVLRNRLSALGSRNKRLVGEGLRREGSWISRPSSWSGLRGDAQHRTRNLAQQPLDSGFLSSGGAKRRPVGAHPEMTAGFTPPPAFALLFRRR
jgi:chromosome partitioning protein